MRHPVKNVYEDPKIDFLARDVSQALKTIPNLNIYKVKAQWSPPFTLRVPYVDGTARVTSPDVVKCERAVNLDIPSSQVTPGGVSWAWAAGNQVRVDKVDGLANGQNYELTFLVIGS